MSFAVKRGDFSSTANEVMFQLHSFKLEVENGLNETIQNIQDVVKSPIGQGVIGFGLGLGLHKIYGPLTQKLLGAVVFGSGVTPDPFRTLGFGSKLLMAPYVCVLAPILEELMFRGGLQEGLKIAFESFYTQLGFQIQLFLLQLV